MTAPKHTPADLWHGGEDYVPTTVATCPECHGELIARCVEWETKTGRPTACGIEIECVNDLEGLGEIIGHQYYQCDWQPVRDAVNRWARGE